mmetsp:Transcript_8767/g.9707  ORF Transcript_8767/g.9707 Transcript_8767/m.9707 type:complete len:83 (-) Transcript_8767:89-337(-)
MIVVVPLFNSSCQSRTVCIIPLLVRMVMVIVVAVVVVTKYSVFVVVVVVEVDEEKNEDTVDDDFLDDTDTALYSDCIIPFLP